jgi:hypothetical protein
VNLAFEVLIFVKSRESVNSMLDPVSFLAVSSIIFLFIFDCKMDASDEF